MSEPEAPQDRLPLSTVVAYGLPTFAGAAMVIPIGIHLTKFYADRVLVPLGFLAIAIAGARAFDAITDPLVGYLSDRTRTRWGRRRPYIALGSPLCALAFVALFSPPAELDPTGGLVWFAATFVLYYLFHTIYLVPYYALGAELSPDYHERSRLFSVREGFLLVGTLSAALIPGLLQEALGGEREALRAFSLVFGSLLALLYVGLAVRVRERPSFADRPANPFVPGVRRAMRNRPFRLLLFAGVFSAVPGTITGTLLPFFNTYVLQPEREGLSLSILLATYFGSALVFLPAWLWASRRYGKKPALLTSYAVGVAGLTPLLFVPAGGTLYAVPTMILAGSAFGALSFIPFAMKADVIDYDELHTGRRREAQFASFWLMVPKFVQVPAAALPIALLGSIGYVPNQPQTPEVELAIRLLVTLAPAIGLGAAAIALWRYPISAERHDEIRHAITARARGEAVIDPLTGHALRARTGEAVAEDDGWFLDHFSLRELRRTLVRGREGMTRDVAIASAASLAIAAACAGGVARGLSGADADPGALVVSGVLVAGGCFTAFVFHLSRLRAARRFAAGEIPEHVVRAHLRG